MAVQVSMPLLDEHEQECLIQDLVDLKPWMTKCRFDLIETEAELEAFIDKAIETGYCAIDTETTGLNLRPDNVNGGLITKIVGWCLAYDDNYGVYVPVRHYDYDRNLPVKVVNKHIKRLLAGVDKVIYHNYKYDGEVMRGEGIIQEDPDKWDDSLILHFVVHPEEERARGLKALSEKYLNRPMIELKELAPTKTKVHDFAIVPPQVATYYGASDAMNTLALWKLFTKNLHDMDPNGSDKKPGLKFIYNTEKRNMIVTMEMERNHVKIDVAYYRNHSDSLYARLEELEHRVYDMVGVKFDIQSSPQLAKILFEDLGIKYPEPRPEGSAGYSTKEEILAKVKGKGEDIINAILEYRGFKKIVSTYLENFLNNYDENDEIKICFHPTKASTGRFSSGGGSLHHDGYSGINGQNIPANYDPKAVDLRKGVIARPGFVFCAIDYSGEELRIATNMSKEPMWLDEFLRGSGDLHMVTATVIFKKPASAISKLERGVAKTLNFLSLYGGGAQGFAQQAKIPLEEAKVALDNFNTGLVGLAEWKDKERRTSKRRGFAQTAFGRRRPLKELYESGDRQLIAAADRHAINSAIQGTGADIMKISMWRVWKHIRQNGWEDYVRFCLSIHDEIVFELREDLLDLLIPAISDIMKMGNITKALGWQVGLEVDAEYGSTFHVDFNYFEQVKDGIRKVATTVEEALANYEEYKIYLAKNGLVEKKEVAMEIPEEILSEESLVVGEIGELGVEGMDIGTDYSEEEEAPKVVKPPHVPLEHNPLRDDYLNYPVTKTDTLARRQADAIWAALETMEDTAQGPKKSIRLLSNDGKRRILFTTTKRYSVDGFLALATFMAI